MKILTKYEAFDGLEFLDSERCLEHESNLNLAESIVSKLPKLPPDSCSFLNGDGYLQHCPKTLLISRNEFLEFFKRYSSHNLIQETIDSRFRFGPKRIGRIISGMAPSSIYHLWCRFQCIDSSFREWGQSYYATNSGEATPKKLN